MTRILLIFFNDQNLLIIFPNMTVASDVFAKLNVKRTKDWAPAALPKKIRVCEESCFVASTNILSNKESKAAIITTPDRKKSCCMKNK